MMTKEGYFMTFGAKVLVQGYGNITALFLFKNLLLYSQAWIRKTKCIKMMTKEVSSYVAYFMTTEAGAWKYKCIFSLKINFFTPKHSSEKLSA